MQKKCVEFIHAAQMLAKSLNALNVEVISYYLCSSKGCQTRIKLYQISSQT